jgi:hypothetical protein
MFASQVAKKESSKPQRPAGAVEQPERSAANSSGSARQAGSGAIPYFLQARLQVGRVGDPLEDEADKVAEQVMRTSVSAPATAAGAPQISRKCASCEEEEKLQAKAAGPDAGSEAPGAVHEVLRAPGEPLDPATRAFMEPRFGLDFSGVRVHAGSSAAQSAQLINAHAYTVGHNIVFDAGRFAPGTHEGQRLLAHELTHVAQQSGPGIQRFSPGKPGGGAASRVSSPMQPTVQRQHEVSISLHPEEIGTFGGYFVLPSKGGEFHYQVELDNVTPLSLDPQYRPQLDFEIEFAMREVMEEALRAKEPLGLLPTLSLRLSPGYSRVLEEGHVQHLVQRAARAELKRILASEQHKAATVLGAIVNIMAVSDYLSMSMDDAPAAPMSPFGDMLPSYYIENKTITDRNDLDLLQAWFDIANGRVTGADARTRISLAADETARYVTLLSGGNARMEKLVGKYQSEVEKFTQGAAREEVNRIRETALAAEEHPAQGEGSSPEDEAIESAAGRTLEVLAELGEVAHRLSEEHTTAEKTKELREAAKERYDEQMQEYIHKVFSEKEFADAPEMEQVERASGGGLANGLAFLKGGLDAVSAIMAVTDPVARKKLYDARSEYFSGTVANYSEIGEVMLKFLSGAVTFGGAATYAVASLAGNAALAERVFDSTVKSIGTIAGPLFLVGVIHGAAVLLDPEASAGEKAEAAVETASSAVGLLGFAARWAPRLGPIAEWSGPISASLTINFYMFKHLLQMGYDFEVSMNEWDWTWCFQETMAAANDAQKTMRELAVSSSLLATETDPYRKAELLKNADGDRYGLIEMQLKPYIEARLTAKSRDDDPAWCGPAFSRRLKPMQALLDSVGNSNDAALGAGAAFLSIVAEAFNEWDKIVMEKE